MAGWVGVFRVEFPHKFVPKFSIRFLCCSFFCKFVFNHFVHFSEKQIFTMISLKNAIKFDEIS